MSTGTGFNIDRLRSPYENKSEWEMRKEFLEAHQGSFPVHRLLCLSNCYINSRLYGCRYPLATMKELEALSIGLILTNTDKIMGVQKVQFVKEKKESKMAKINFVKASEDITVKQECDRVSIQILDNVTTKNSVTDNNFIISTSTTKSSTLNTTEHNTISTTKPDIPSTTNPITPSTTKPQTLNTTIPCIASTMISSSPSTTTLSTSSTTTANTVSLKTLLTRTSVKSNFASHCEPKPVTHPPPKLKRNTQAEIALSTKNDMVDCISVDMTPVEQQIFDLAKVLEELLKKDVNHLPKDFLPIAAIKNKSVFTYKYKELPAPKGLHKFVCCVTFDSVELAEGEGGSKKKARHNSIEVAGNKLCKKFLKVVKLNPETQVLKTSDDYFPSAWSLHEEIPSNNSAMIHKESNAVNLARSKKRKFSETSNDLSRFLLIEPKETTSTDNAKAILQRSADFNKAILEYEYHDEGTGVRCRVILEGHVLVDCFGTGRLTVKNAAAEKALEGLKQMCWTIKVKQAVDSDEAGLSRDEIFGEIQAQVKAIPEDNKGRQLLMKMGWTGGGVGAEGNKGLEVPVAEELSKNQVICRAGLGSRNSSEKEFRNKVVEALEIYTKSGKQEDLMFTADFTKDERAYIHQQAQKLGLKTQSRGSGEARYLTVSRRRSAFQLFNHLLEEGGSTAKYELVAPGQSSKIESIVIS
ncbi:uncharacterized protein LOC132562855 [Ylistrum balloti]|uniref:uncharacterized protein LOC132562855 n=1 Tax=Ylistrum balloti TaxID=509963 RepID=UPI002905B957|nr:uncharacterized protein LOC132562855 [Ylistrum balloti]